MGAALHLDNCVHFFLSRRISSLCTFLQCSPRYDMRHDSNCARRTVTQSVEIQSISLSLMTLITRMPGYKYLLLWGLIYQKLIRLEPPGI